MAVYLITGAAQGLGRAFATSLAKQDQAQLILLDKDMRGLNSLVETLENQCEVALFPMDLLGATPEDYELLYRTIKDNYPQLDAVFLNAVAFQGFTPLINLNFESWYEVLHTNLNANFHLTQSLLPLLKQSDDAKLVAIIDLEVENHPAYYGAYGVAKAGLEQMMKTLAAEHKSSESLHFYNAKLNAFQSNMRSKHFPSENPNSLPSAQSIADNLVEIVLNNMQAELIELL